MTTQTATKTIMALKFLAWITWPKYWSLRLCTAVSRRSHGWTSCSTDTLLQCAFQNSPQQHSELEVTMTSWFNIQKWHFSNTTTTITLLITVFITYDGTSAKATLPPSASDGYFAQILCLFCCVVLILLFFVCKVSLQSSDIMPPKSLLSTQWTIKNVTFYFWL